MFWLNCFRSILLPDKAPTIWLSVPKSSLVTSQDTTSCVLIRGTFLSFRATEKYGLLSSCSSYSLNPSPYTSKPSLLPLQQHYQISLIRNTPSSPNNISPTSTEPVNVPKAPLISPSIIALEAYSVPSCRTL